MSSQREEIAEGIERATDDAVVRWITVVETLQPDGRSLDVFSSGPDGYQLTPWDEDGLLHQALYHRQEWEDQDDDRDDERGD